MSSFVETKAMEQLTKSPMEFVEYPSQALGWGVARQGLADAPGICPHLHGDISGLRCGGSGMIWAALLGVGFWEHGDGT